MSLFHQHQDEKSQGKKIIWHIRIKSGIRQFFPSYRQHSEYEIKKIPDKYWQDDPIHLFKLKSGEIKQQDFTGKFMT